MTDLYDDAEAGQVQPVPAAAGSPLSGLRARRDAARQTLHKDLAVPRYDPPVFVRFRPLTQAEVDAAQKTHEKSKDPERTVVVNAGLLAKACLGVFELDGQGREVSVLPDDRDGDWPRFDERLAELVCDGPETRASAIVRALYLTDGDLIATAGVLTEWSGYGTEGLEREQQGN